MPLRVSEWAARFHLAPTVKVSEIGLEQGSGWSRGAQAGAPAPRVGVPTGNCRAGIASAAVSETPGSGWEWARPRPQARFILDSAVRLNRKEHKERFFHHNEHHRIAHLPGEAPNDRASMNSLSVIYAFFAVQLRF